MLPVYNMFLCTESKIWAGSSLQSSVTCRLDYPNLVEHRHQELEDMDPSAVDLPVNQDGTCTCWLFTASF